MKKYFKLLFINLAIIICTLFLVEFVSFKILQSKDPNFKYKFLSKTVEEKIQEMGYGRGHIHINNGLGSIIFFGCCTTDGASIRNDSGLISSIFSRLTNRTVYNRAAAGFGLQHMFYQLKEPVLQNVIDVEPDYIIYTIIRDHYRRLFSNSSANEPKYLKYKLKDGELIREKDSLLNRSLLHYLMRQFYCQNHFDVDLVNLYLIKSKEEAKRKWPNVKFVVLDFDGIEEFKNNKVLEENGIQVINVQKFAFGKPIYLLDKKYCADEFCHPSPTYWELVVPGIIEEIGINKNNSKN